MGRWRGQTNPAGWAGTGWASFTPAPHPYRTRVTLFLALRKAWGNGQKGQSSAVTCMGPGYCTALHLSSAHARGDQSVFLRARGDLQMSEGWKGLAENKCSVNASCCEFRLTSNTVSMRCLSRSRGQQAGSSGAWESAGARPTSAPVPSCICILIWPFAQHHLPFLMVLTALGVQSSRSGSARLESSPGSARWLGDFGSVT